MKAVFFHYLLQSPILAANLVAYHLEQLDKSMLDVTASRELAEKMDVDEIHFLKSKKSRSMMDTIFGKTVLILSFFKFITPAFKNLLNHL